MNARPKILFYVQHLLGIGHLMRAGTLARALEAGGKAAAGRRSSAFKARTMREERYDQQFGGGPCR